MKTLFKQICFLGLSFLVSVLLGMLVFKEADLTKWDENVVNSVLFATFVGYLWLNGSKVLYKKVRWGL